MQFIIDDNANPMVDFTGLRPDFSTIAKVATGASITELTLASLNVAANQTTNGCVVIRVSLTGANPAFFSLGPAGTVPGANSAMITIQANSVVIMKANKSDVSCYHQQITGSSNLEVCALA